MNNTATKKINSNLKFVYSGNDSLSVIFHDNELLLGVAGEFNVNLKELEKISKVSIYSRGNSIMIKSDSVQNEIIKNAIQFLATQYINNKTIEKKIKNGQSLIRSANAPDTMDAVAAQNINWKKKSEPVDA